jgi:hypothetical protein
MSIKFTDHVAAEKFIEMAENVAAIKAKLEDLPELKKKVERHERAYTIGKYASVPVLGIFHLAARQFWNKLGF